MTELANRHPVDEMKDVKDQIEQLENRYAELRQWIIEHPDDRQGEEWKAAVSHQPRFTRLDLKAITGFLGDQIDQFRLPAPRTIINLYPINKYLKRGVGTWRGPKRRVQT